MCEKENSAMERLCSMKTTTVEDNEAVAVNDDEEAPIVLALPLPNHHQQITKLTLFSGSSDHEDHPTPTPTVLSAPRIEDYYLASKNDGDLADLIHAASYLSLSLFPQPINNGPKKPIKNRWDFDELIDAASSLSLSLHPTKRKRFIIIGPNKKPVEEEEKGVIAKKHKVAVDKTSPTGRPQPLDAVLGNHHHHLWIHKRLSTSDVNLSSRLLLPKEDITKYVLPLMDMESCRACQNRDGLRVKIWDLDTESQHQLTLKQWKTASFLLTSNWNTEFVKRRSLHQGDTISMCWDVQNLRFLFRKFNAQS